jgi:hypothetical protein
MTNNLHQEERTESTDFELLEGPDEDSDGTRLFLEIYTTNVHYLLELDHDELEDLRARLDALPTPLIRTDQ